MVSVAEGRHGRVMRCLDVIVDHHGEVWQAPFDRLRLAAGTEAGDHEFIPYAIRNLGFVRLQQKQHGVVLAVRPSAINPVTFASTMFLVSDLHDQRVILSCLNDSWSHSLCRDIADARARLLREMNRIESAREQGFLRERRRLDEAPSGSPISTLLTLWGAGPRILDDNELQSVLHTVLRGRFALLSTHADRETLIIEDWGYGVGSYRASWLRQCKGLQFEDQPDYRYGRAAAAAYREAARSDQPLFDHVDATTGNAGRGRKRIRYHRLILPLRKPGGPPWLLSTSLLDDSIDLRKTAVHQT
jgi:hypothetical protein